MQFARFTRILRVLLSSMLILAQKCPIGVYRETARRQMGGKTGEWGEGPAGATVPYDVRGLHAARGAKWTARRGEIRSKLKN